MNFGSRFCAKRGDAFGEIVASSPSARRPVPRSARPRSSPSAKLIIALTICTATGPRLAISAASALGARQPSPGGDDLVDETQRERLLGVEHLPGRAPCGAPTEAPKRRTSRCVPDQPGAMPSPRLRQAELDAASRQCECRRPPPVPIRRRRRGPSARRSRARAGAPALRRRDGPRGSSRATSPAAAVRPRRRCRRPRRTPCPRR